MFCVFVIILFLLRDTMTKQLLEKKAIRGLLTVSEV